MNDAREAERLLSIGAVARAEAVCRQLLAEEPEHPTALMILSVVLMTTERWEDAQEMLLRGCAAHPGVVGFHAALGRLYLQLNQPARAVPELENCVLLEPDRRDHRATLVAVYQSRLFASFSEESKQAMLACLADDSLTHSLMNKAWLSLLRLDPEGAALVQLFDGALDYSAFSTQLTPALLHTFQEYELMQSGLRRFLAADVSVERGLTFMRRWFQENAGARDRFLPLLCALAQYCFFSEYVFTAAEEFTPLRDTPSTAAAVALLGCYEPLFRRQADAELARISGLSDDPRYGAMVRRLIDEPRAEVAIERDIVALTPIQDPVSVAVRRQYEENPYPRWTTVGSRHQGAAGSAPDRAGETTGAGGKNILVVGCGTGREAVDAALNFPASRVEAIDLSRASLAYAIRRAKELGLENLEFAQADLLQLGRVRGRRRHRQYELITASGVLHHLADPRAGLRALRTVLSPGGILRVGLYSRLARTAVAETRHWIASAGFPSTAQGIRDFRAAVMARDAADPIRAWLTNSYDFYSLSQCRDLVFHVQEHTFTLPEVAAMLHDFGLSVIQVDIRSPAHLAQYHQQFPDDPGAVDLANWHVMEQRHPTLFAGMYSLWLCRTTEQEHLDLDWVSQASSELQ